MFCKNSRSLCSTIRSKTDFCLLASRCVSLCPFVPLWLFVSLFAFLVPLDAYLGIPLCEPRRILEAVL